jgi:type III secretory pathway lipoprotein EscJ
VSAQRKRPNQALELTAAVITVIAAGACEKKLMEQLSAQDSHHLLALLPSEPEPLIHRARI